MTQSYTGHLPFTDEGVERQSNSEHGQSGLVGWKYVQPIDSSGNVIANGLNLKPYDYVARVLTNSTTETYTFRSGGSGGTVTNTVVIVYTDSSLATILNVTKT